MNLKKMTDEELETELKETDRVIWNLTFWMTTNHFPYSLPNNEEVVNGIEKRGTNPQGVEKYRQRQTAIKYESKLKEELAKRIRKTNEKVQKS